MATWKTIGTLKPTHEWQIFGVEVDRQEIFQIEHSYFVKPVGWALIGQFFTYPNRLHGVHRIYPQKISSIVHLDIPDYMIATGYRKRPIGIKLADTTFVSDENWQITVSFLA